MSAPDFGLLAELFTWFGHYIASSEATKQQLQAALDQRDAEIDDLRLQLAGYKAQVEYLTPQPRCPNCGSYVPGSNGPLP
jgi:hypothetical protein